MKMSPEFERVAKVMMPGEISKEGFFGHDTRPLADIIQQDEEEMGRLGLEFEAVTQKLRELIEKGKRAYGSPLDSGELMITVDEARGSIPCPFRDGRFPKRSTTITHRVSGTSLVVSDLALHLFCRHHFLQGKGSAFRLEPGVLKKVLDL